MSKAKIRLRMESLHPDPERYKPYDISYTPAKDTFVELEIDPEEIVEEEGDAHTGRIILTPDGMVEIATQLAKAIRLGWWDFEMWSSREA